MNPPKGHTESHSGGDPESSSTRTLWTEPPFATTAPFATTTTAPFATTTPRPFDQDDAALSQTSSADISTAFANAPPGFRKSHNWKRMASIRKPSLDRRSALSTISRRLRLGLRARTTFALALSSLVISVAVSSLTYFVARNSFVKERRINVQRLTFANAEVASRELTADQNMNVVLARIDAESGLAATSLLVYDNQEFSGGGALLSQRDIPESLRVLLTSATTKDVVSGYQITNGPTGAQLVFGVSLPQLGNIQFYELASMAEVEAELRKLARALAVAAIASTIGAAFIGSALSRRVVAPLRDVANAAAEITKGQFDTRLPTTGDADLDPLLRSFNTMAESLKGRLEREARFASDVSHELRTPLTALSTAAQLLNSRRDEMPERSQRALDVLVTQTRYFERLVLDLLEISRFDAGAAELHREVLNLPDFIDQVIFVNGSEAALDVTALSTPEASLDKRRLERIVANLLQNANTYAGGASRVILRDTMTNVSPAELGGNVPADRIIEIAVDDEGPGVPDDEKSVVFERFRRGTAHVRGTFAQKGTGLGLSLVAAHVALHHGQAWVEDRPGGGARFVVTLLDEPPHDAEDLDPTEDADAL